MSEDKTRLLLDRAIFLIMAEWGYDKERAIGWLNDEEMWNSWDYDGKWVGSTWVEDESKINSHYPSELRTEPLPDAVAARAERE